MRIDKKVNKKEKPFKCKGLSKNKKLRLLIKEFSFNKIKINAEIDIKNSFL
jgi:hypothetical protein